MTATDELRKLLDERGVEWSDRANAWTYETHWNGADGKPVCASQRSDGIGDLVLKQHVIPEQAIAVTLGQGTCERVFIEDWLWECSACKSRWKTGHLFNYCPTCGRKVVEQ